MFWLTRSSVCFENIFIMRLSQQSSTSWSYLFLLVMLGGSEVRGQPCPSGQITHHDEGQTWCCLPAYCDPTYYLEYCKKNGTSDTCLKCPSTFGLYKRTSSFAVEPCHLLLATGVGEERCTAESDSKAAMEDRMNCLCNLELGYYYLEPQFSVGLSSFCQVVRDECKPGHQPNQKGHCEPCPPNTVQDVTGFMLCRPQRNCSALRLETKVPGSASREAVCADPPPLPAVSTVSHVVSSTSPTSPPMKSTTPIPSDASVRTVVDSKNDASMIVVLVVVCSVVVLVACALLVFCGRRRGWFTCLKGKCYGDVERHPGSGSQLQLSNRDNDNTSDNSCYTCTDSCLTSSNKNNSSTGGAGAKSPGGCEASKAARPLPMLEAFMNRNGKCPDNSLCSAGTLSEPIYNSIGQDERLKVSGGGGSMPSYKNTAGLCPSAGLRQGFQDFQPNRVQLVPGDEGDCCHNGALYAQVQPRGLGVGKGGGREPRDDCNETDPLLPPLGSEHGSSGTPTPVATPALRGILRNGNNHQPRHCQETQRSGGGGEGGGDRGVVGNRPHLSMLLNAPDDTSSPVVGDESQVANLPYLSQLVSGAQRSLQAAPGPPPPQPPQHQQLQQQAAQPPQDVLPPQRGALQGSPMAARLVPVSLAMQQQQQQPQLDPSLVQMDELKPIPLSPGSNTTTPSPTSPTIPQSPARITPTQQVLRGGGGASNSATPRPEPVPVSAGPATAAPPPASAAQTVKKGTSGKAAAAGKVEEDRDVQTETDNSVTKQKDRDVQTETDNSVTKQKEINEETFQKQAASAGAGVGSEDTMQKSVCGSSGLGDSLEFSSPLELPSEEDGRSRTMYRRSNSEASRSVSPVHQLPPSRSISTPEEKHRPFAVVKPMQSDQSLNTMSDSQDHMSELTQHLDAVRRDFPLTSLVSHSPARQTSQTSSDASEQTRPKTPDSVSQDDPHGERVRRESEEQTSALFYGANDSSQGDGADRRDKDGDEREL